MRRRRTGLVVGIALAAIVLPAVSAAAPLTPAQTFTPQGFFRFCAEAQIDIANVDQTKLVENGGQFSIRGTIYRTTLNTLTPTSDFVFSKSAVSTSAKAILTTQWTQYRDAGFTSPDQIRCKLRTGESFVAGAWPPGSPNNGGRFAVEPAYGFGAAGAGLSTNPVDQQCRVVNQRTIDNVWATLSPPQQDAAPFNPTGVATTGAAANTLVTVPDTVATDGPDWTPSFPTYLLDGSTLQIPSKALVVPVGSASLPRFEGAHYCTHIAPELLRDILLGAVTP
jgi:hypothetical protein